MLYVDTKIPDITPNAFDFLIKYIHGLNPPITTEIVVDVLYLSKKYLIKPIELACTKRLQSMFASIDSVDAIFAIASKLHALAMDVCDVCFFKIVFCYCFVWLNFCHVICGCLFFFCDF